MTVSLSTDFIRERIAAVQSSLPPTVRLIGVTKKVPSDMVRVGYGCGLREFGESRIQEALAKQTELADLEGITWHLIGHLQTNKARKALLHFDWIHSLDSLKLAHKLNELAAELSRTPYCCLQVKIAPDPAKYGFDVEALWQALPALNQMEHLKIVGLMTIPPLESSMADIERIFKQAHDLADQINLQSLDRLHITELSMGMSGDYLAAIAAGSTMIRLGSKLFGDRPA
ncbi:MAG: YggS family pyridoxal phosphate-dependent enzyme [Leptolyngbya sp. SIO1E4]|nr:YggS family pyridoxal phosphate-dependent enzyme [Leptolyngbya sp. SIO1E4]